MDTLNNSALSFSNHRSSKRNRTTKQFYCIYKRVICRNISDFNKNYLNQKDILFIIDRLLPHLKIRVPHSLLP